MRVDANKFMRKFVFVSMLISVLLSSCVSGNQKTDASEEESTAVEEDLYNGWEVRNYLDEFNEETTEKYVTKIFYGTFSNTATTNSSLSVVVLIDSLKASFKLYEYDQLLVKAEETIWFNYKNQDDETGTILCWNSEDGITGILHSWDLEDLDKQERVRELRNLITKNSEIKFSVKTNDELSKYVFKIDTKGLAEILRDNNLPLEK